SRSCSFHSAACLACSMRAKRAFSPPLPPSPCCSVRWWPRSPMGCCAGLRRQNLVSPRTSPMRVARCWLSVLAGSARSCPNACLPKVDVTTIDNDPEMMDSAAGFGFRVYYGDGTRLDVLRAAGAREARVIAVCIDDPEAASRIVDLVQAEVSGAKLYVRSFDRRHTLQLLS